MEGDKNLDALFKLATGFRFGEFAALFDEMGPHIPAEAYLMRAQIKLFAADSTLCDDLDKAAQTAAAPLRYPCLGTVWQPDTPNRFVVFPESKDAMQCFLQSLPRVSERLASWYKEAGAAMVRQIQSEILYFTGAFQDALELAKEQCLHNWERHDCVLLAQYVQYRCYLAMGAAENAEQCMVDIVRLVELHPECQSAYAVVRVWANITTGWSGETPRFYQESSEELPVLDDRLKAIQRGISRLSLQEEAFLQFAKAGYSPAGTMRQLYMEIFHAVYWFQLEEYGQARQNLEEACRTTVGAGLLMPFVEYGEQIAPLIRYAQANGWNCPKDWLAGVLSKAGQYEASLEAYRA